MSSAIVIADTGHALQRLTEELSKVPGLAILRHYCGRGPLPGLAAAIAPDIVVMDEMRWPRLALLRISELQNRTDTRIIVCASRPEARWHADALRAGAHAIVPADGGILRLVVQEVIDDLRLARTSTTYISLAA